MAKRKKKRGSWLTEERVTVSVRVDASLLEWFSTIARRDRTSRNAIMHAWLLCLKKAADDVSVKGGANWEPSARECLSLLGSKLASDAAKLGAVGDLADVAHAEFMREYETLKRIDGKRSPAERSRMLDQA